MAVPGGWARGAVRHPIPSSHPSAGDIVPIPTLPTEAVHAFLRVTFSLLATGANTNGICFDYHAIIDKS